MPTPTRRRLLFGNRPFSPDQLPGLRLWLRADRGVMKGSPAAQLGTPNKSLSILDSLTSGLLEIGDNDVTITCWVYADVLPGTSMSPIGKLNTTLDQCSYGLDVVGANNKFRFTVSPDGILANNVSISTTVVATTNRWYFVCLQHDAANDLIKISVDGAAFETLAFAGGVKDSTATFFIGAVLSTTTQNFRGRVQAVQFWRTAAGGGGVLSLSAVQALYNGGVARLYASLSAGEQTNLVAAWDLTEESGTRADSSGNGLTLTDNNTTTCAAGNNLSAAGNTDPVMVWRPIVGINDAGQGVAASRPTLQTAVINNQPVLACAAASSQYLTLATALALTDWTLLAIFKRAATGTFMIPVGGSASRAVEVFTDNAWYFASASGALGGPNAHTSDTNPTIGVWQNSLTAFNTRKNGVQISAAGVAGNLDATYIGRRAVPSYTDGSLAEIILCSSVLSTADIARVERYASQHYGIAVT